MVLIVEHSLAFSVDMDAVSFDYSTKNIPIVSNREAYLKKILDKTELFLKRMRWRAFFYLNPTIKSTAQDTYGFKSRLVPPPINELKEFENRLINLVKNIKFNRKANCQFQQALNTDVNKIKKGEHMLVKADKTTNFYKMKPDDYNSLLNKNVCKTYKKAKATTVPEINTEAKGIACKINLDDRIEKMANKAAFVTLKDHKDNFRNNPTCRLINPAKSELGHVSKTIVSKINRAIVSKTNINLWRNTGEVVEWFKSVQNKSESFFICFDVTEFYPSITEGTLKDALTFASRFTNISDNDIEIVLHARKSLLFHNNVPWTKKASGTSFDVTMGSFDGAEICELIGCMILSELQTLYGNNIGLYRDDGLAAFNDTPRNIEIIKKNICKIFSKYKLQVTIEANKRVVDFLDVTLDLNSGRYSPFHKANNTTQYVHSQSNHPPSILKNLPSAINKRLCDLSSDADAFSQAKPMYQEALNKSGYNYNLTYSPVQQRTDKRRRSRNITWYNPPFDLGVYTNIGHEFLKIIKQSFPQSHPLGRLFNKNTVKLSYSCMPNLKNIIDGRNKTLLNDSNNDDINNKQCNCRRGTDCPLDGNCLTESIVYKATVETNNSKETYVGLTEGKFKTRYNNHKSSFNHPSKKNSTELSKHIWSLKEQGTAYNIKWSILKRARAYSNNNKRCGLCLSEKFYIIFMPELSSLNKRGELISTCRHSRKFILKYM